MKILPVVLLSLMIISCTSTSRIYVVRHAEKLDNTPYSVLSPKGHERAARLRDMLADKKVDMVFATTFQRTQETAQPLAAALNQQLHIYRNNAVDSIAGVMKGLAGKNILLVGHSGNIPSLIKTITGKEVAAMKENEYGKIYIIRMKKQKMSVKEGNY
jgi:broad specificity phosphatase PhoE